MEMMVEKNPKDSVFRNVNPKNFVIQLGKRVNKVIIEEKNVYKVYPKGWIAKKTWREINDILSLSGFCWLSNGKEGFWVNVL